MKTLKPVRVFGGVFRHVGFKQFHRSGTLLFCGHKIRKNVSRLRRIDYICIKLIQNGKKVDYIPDDAWHMGLSGTNLEPE
jgi:hypothetical protein